MAVHKKNEPGIKYAGKKIIKGKMKTKRLYKSMLLVAQLCQCRFKHSKHSKKLDYFLYPIKVIKKEIELN